MRNWDEEDQTDEGDVDDMPYDDDEHIDWDSPDEGDID